MLKWKTVDGIATATPGRTRKKSYCRGDGCRDQIDSGWEVKDILAGGKTRMRLALYCDQCIRPAAEKDREEIAAKARLDAREAHTSARLNAMKEELVVAETRAKLALEIADKLDVLGISEAEAVLRSSALMLNLGAGKPQAEWSIEEVPEESPAQSAMSLVGSDGCDIPLKEVQV